MADPQMPVVTCNDYWGYWGINYYYYGERRPGLSWCVMSIKPNTEEAAKELLALAPKITENIRGREQGVITGILAAVLPRPDEDYRLRAEKTPTGWRISEYDFNKWSFDIS